MAYILRERAHKNGFQAISTKITSLSSLDCRMCWQMCVRRIVSERVVLLITAWGHCHSLGSWFEAWAKYNRRTKSWLGRCLCLHVSQHSIWQCVFISHFSQYNYFSGTPTWMLAVMFFFPSSLSLCVAPRWPMKLGLWRYWIWKMSDQTAKDPSPVSTSSLGSHPSKRSLPSWLTQTIYHKCASKSALTDVELFYLISHTGWSYITLTAGKSL